MGKPALAFSLVSVSGFFLGLFLRMADIYSDGYSFVSIFSFNSFRFIVLGMAIVLSFWLIYSAMVSKITASDMTSVLEKDSKTYLPLLLLSFYAVQFTPAADDAVTAFSSINPEFTEKFFLLPAKLILFLVINLVLFLKIHALDLEASKISSRLRFNAKALLFAFISIYALVFSYLSISMYQNYHTDYDLAIYNQAIWSTTKGELLVTSLERGTHPEIDIASHFTNHFSPVYFLITPLYLIFPFVETLLVIQSVMLGLGALPAFWIGRRYLGEAGGLVFALVYLLYPSVNYINTFDFHEAAFTVPFLLFTVYYFLEERFRKFLAFAVLSMMCKENIAPLIFMFGLYALYLRRSVKWIAVPSLLGFLWFTAVMYYVIPFFREGSAYVFIKEYYPHLGSTPGEIVKTMLLHPFFTIKQMLSFEKFVYIILIFLPVSFSSLLNSTLLIALPTFLQNLLSTFRPLYSVNYQFMQGIIPFVIASAVMGTKTIVDSRRLDRVLRYVNNKMGFASTGEKKKFSVLSFILINALAMNILYSPSPIGTFYNPEDYSFSAEKKASLQTAMDLIPDDASVATQVWYTAHLSKRTYLYEFSNETNEKVDYILVDKERLLPWEADNFAYVSESKQWERVFEENEIMVFKRIKR